MTHRIYTLTEKAIEEMMDWDTAIAEGEIQTVEEFDSYEEAVESFENNSYDTDFYGVE